MIGEKFYKTCVYMMSGRRVYPVVGMRVVARDAGVSRLVGRLVRAR